MDWMGSLCDKKDQIIMNDYENSPEGMSDIIYFAIQATRSEGDKRIHYLKRLKQLCKAELEFEKAKQNIDNSITRFFRKKNV